MGRSDKERELEKGQEEEQDKNCNTGNYRECYRNNPPYDNKYYYYKNEKTSIL
jgi:hypothetical protein